MGIETVRRLKSLPIFDWGPIYFYFGRFYFISPWFAFEVIYDHGFWGGFRIWIPKIHDLQRAGELFED